MGKHSQFPWDLLKAECLRLVCSQLVQASNEALTTYPGGGRKEDMIEFLRDVETRTLDAAVETLQKKNSAGPRKSTGAAESASPGKRTRANEENASDEDEDGYNTRFKGVKRVKVREDQEESGSQPKRTPRKSTTSKTETPGKRGRGRPRKSAPEGDKPDAEETEETDKAAATDADDADGEGEPKKDAETPKRGRGRPKKGDPKPIKTPKPKAAPKPKAEPKPKSQPPLDAEGNPIKRGRGRPRKSAPEGAPLSKGKEVFDGVHLQNRKAETQDEGDDANPDGEGEEEDAVLAAVNINGGTNGLDDGASSPGYSNKENDPSQAFPATNAGGDHDVDMDADGDVDGDTEQNAAAPVAAV